MVAKRFHKEAFDKGTQTKLEIFDNYFNESFPVFINGPWKEVFVYDFFAGKGKDNNGELGTSLNILKAISNYCESIKKGDISVYIILNDKSESETLKENVCEFISECEKNCGSECILQLEKNLKINNREFDGYFQEIYPKLKSRNRSAKLIFLDPFGFVMNNDIFNMLISLPATDFICFMPSSYLRRFRDFEQFNKYIDTERIDFENSRPEECHRVISNYFDSLIPENKEYYIGNFSIKKGANYYGLLFGSNHTFGAEKFQKVCWAKDDVTGEADYAIDRDLCYDKTQQLLFQEHTVPKKIQEFNSELRVKILDKTFTTDKETYKFALKKRCKISYASDVLKQLMEEKKIARFRTKNNNIHLIKEPKQIELL